MDFKVYVHLLTFSCDQLRDHQIFVSGSQNYSALLTVRNKLDQAAIGLIMFIALKAVRYLHSEYACMESHPASFLSVHITEDLHNLTSTNAFKSLVIAIKKMGKLILIINYYQNLILK